MSQIAHPVFSNNHRSHKVNLSLLAPIKGFVCSHETSVCFVINSIYAFFNVGLTEKIVVKFLILSQLTSSLRSYSRLKYSLKIIKVFIENEKKIVVKKSLVDLQQKKRTEQQQQKKHEKLNPLREMTKVSCIWMRFVSPFSFSLPQ